MPESPDAVDAAESVDAARAWPGTLGPPAVDELQQRGTVSGQAGMAGLR